MTATKTLTLIFALSLLSLVFPVVSTHVDTPSARHNVPSTHRMLKKRVSSSLKALGINNAAGAVPQQPPNGNGSPAGSDTAIASPTLPVVPTNTARVPPDATGTAITLITPLPTASLRLPPSVLNSTSSTSSVSSTSTTSSSSSTSLTSTSTSTDTPTTTAPSITQITVTSSSTQTPTPTAATSGKSVTTIQRNTIIILIAIGGSIGAAGLIWTVIRKWKFRPSSSFEDRMQPIDWQPTTTAGGEQDMSQRLGRSATVRSHGSFTSGNDHDLVADIPSHDFTAGAAHLAPGAGYADLQRGPSPQPDYGQYRYDIPNPHHGGGGAYNNNAGGYQGGGYDQNRGY